MARGKKNYPLSVSIAAVDKISAPLKKIRDRIKRTFAPVSNLSARLKIMSKSAGLDRMIGGIRKVGGGVMKLTRTLGGLVLKLGAVAAAASAAAFMLIKSFAGKGDQLVKMSARLGVGIEALQELEYAAASAMVDQSQLHNALQKLGIRAGETARGLGQAKIAFDLLGISVKDSGGELKSAEALFSELADAFEKVPTAERLDLANAIFGGRGTGVLQMFLQGSQGLRDAAAKLQDSGSIITEDVALQGEAATQAIEDATRAFIGMKNAILKHALVPFTDLMKTIETWLKGNRKDVSAWVADFMVDLPDHIETVKAKLKEIGEGIADLASRVWTLVEAVEALGKRLGFVNLMTGGAILATTAWSVSLFGSLFGSLKKAAGAVKTFAVAVWTKVLPALWVALVSTIRWAAALIGPLLVALGRATMAVVRFGLAFLLNPVGLTVAALVGAGYLLWKHWDKITAWLGDKFGWLWDLWNDTIGAILPDMGGIVSKFTGMFGGGDSPAASTSSAKRHGPANEAFLSKVSGSGQGPAGADQMARMMEAMAPGGGEGRMKIIFDNMPEWARAELDPTSDIPVELERGFALGL